MQIRVIHGPNLNLLGKREPQHYGNETLEEINQKLNQLGASLGCEVECLQSNHEGQIVDWIHQSIGTINGIIINPGAYTHTSIAIRDAITAVGIPTIEVHLSNIHNRESFRHKSFIAPVALGSIIGLGSLGYELALYGLTQYLKREEKGN